MIFTLNKYTIAKHGTTFVATRGNAPQQRDLSGDGLILEMYQKLKEQEKRIAELEEK
jgi:hypothetical protein